MAATRWLTRREVADLRGVSLDTVKRDEQRGVYRRLRPRPGDPSGRVEIAYDDLVAAGHAAPDERQPDEESRSPDSEAGAAGCAGTLVDLRVRLARAEAERAALAVALEHARRDIEELRELVRLAVGGASR